MDESAYSDYAGGPDEVPVRRAYATVYDMSTAIEHKEKAQSSTVSLKVSEGL